MLASARFSSGPWSHSPGAAATTTEASRAATRQRRQVRIKQGTTVKLWIMPNGPQPKEDMEKVAQAVHREDRHQRRRRSRRLGRPARPHPQRRRLGRGPGRHAGRHHAGAVLRRARRVRGPVGRVGDIGGEGAYADGVWKTTQVVGQDGAWAVPWFTEARVDLLPQGRPREGRRRSRDRLHRLGRVPQHARRRSRTRSRACQPFGSPGKKAFDLVHHVMPFVWDAGGAELSEDNKQVDDQQRRGRAGREVLRRPGQGRTVRPEPARA